MIKIEKINTLCKGKYLELKEIYFDLDGVKKRWEMVKGKDSVACLVYDKELESIILVKQFRLPLYLRGDNNGYSYELCAGLMDKEGLNEVETIKEEVLEECGYDIDTNRFEKISLTYANVGNMATKQDIFYVEVTQKDKVNKGGGVDDEKIEVVEIKKDKLEEFLFNENNIITPGAKFALMWWIHYKLKGKN